MASRARRLALVAVALAAIALPSIAGAQCAKDTDCKGERVCANGRCVGSSRDWSLAGGVVGAVGAGITLGFTVQMDVILPADPPPASIGIAVASVPVTIIGAAVAAAGGRSARRAEGVDGEPGARVAGWIFFGLDLAFVPVMSVVSALYLEGPPAPGWMTVFGLGGALAQSLLAADAFVARAQITALKKAATSPPPAAASARGPRLAPFAAPSAEGGAVLGLVGTF